jgi:hypothetical protein
MVAGDDKHVTVLWGEPGEDPIRAGRDRFGVIVFDDRLLRGLLTTVTVCDPAPLLKAIRMYPACQARDCAVVVAATKRNAADAVPVRAGMETATGFAIAGPFQCLRGQA